MFREFELPFVPFVVSVLSLSSAVIVSLSLLQTAPDPACICRDATRAGELGHLPHCPSFPPDTYAEFRGFRDVTAVQ